MCVHFNVINTQTESRQVLWCVASETTHTLTLTSATRVFFTCPLSPFFWYFISSLLLHSSLIYTECKSYMTLAETQTEACWQSASINKADTAYQARLYYGAELD